MRRIWIFVLLALVAAITIGDRASAQELGGMSEVSVDGGTARLRGLALGNPSVHVYVNDTFAGSARALPEFEFEVSLTPGSHEICTYAIAPGSPGNPILGCELVEVEAAAPGPWIAVSSDFHVATPGGRWPENSARLEAFVAELNDHPSPPEMLVVAGDMVDNIAVENGQPAAGDLVRWNADVDRYFEIVERLQEITLLHALGPGHDFGPSVGLDVAREAFGRSFGHRTWRGTRIIWLDSSPSAAQVRWLDWVLARTPGEAVLAFHMPLRTATTERLDSRRTLPPDDPLYEVLERHAPRIAAVINGHIHRASASHLFGIPVHLCPLIDGGSYCRIVATDDGIVIERALLKPWQ